MQSERSTAQTTGVTRRPGYDPNGLLGRFYYNALIRFIFLIRF